MSVVGVEFCVPRVVRCVLWVHGFGFCVSGFGIGVAVGVQLVMEVARAARASDAALQV